VAGRDGRHSEQLRALSEDLGLEGRVRLLGARDDVADLLVAADVFAFPSRWEGAGGAMLEAMALRCPVVATDLPTLREAAGDTAVYCPVGDPSALAHALASALSDPARTAERARRAEALFDEKYSMAAVTRGMLDFYERALG
jgi:glycosyltransferase involved in cell wall biosynthesis